MKNILLIGIIVFTMGCSNEPEETSNVVQIRVKNSSSFQYSDLVVNTGDGEHNYGDLDSNEVSTYASFNSAYSYAYVELKIEDRTFILQPIDYVGETLLASGDYTYDISVSDIEDEYGNLLLTLIED